MSGAARRRLPVRPAAMCRPLARSGEGPGHVRRPFGHRPLALVLRRPIEAPSLSPLRPAGGGSVELSYHFAFTLALADRLVDHVRTATEPSAERGDVARVGRFADRFWPATGPAGARTDGPTTEHRRFFPALTPASAAVAEDSAAASAGAVTGTPTGTTTRAGAIARVDRLVRWLDRLDQGGAPGQGRPAAPVPILRLASRPGRQDPSTRSDRSSRAHPSDPPNSSNSSTPVGGVRSASPIDPGVARRRGGPAPNMTRLGLTIASGPGPGPGRSVAAERKTTGAPGHRRRPALVSEGGARTSSRLVTAGVEAVLPPAELPPVELSPVELSPVELSPVDRELVAAAPNGQTRLAATSISPTALPAVAPVDRVHRRSTPAPAPAAQPSIGPVAAGPIEPAVPASIDLDRLDRDLWRRFEKRMRVEQERRGRR